jgi:hypothetical protein
MVVNEIPRLTRGPENVVFTETTTYEWDDILTAEELARLNQEEIAKLGPPPNARIVSRESSVDGSPYAVRALLENERDKQNERDRILQEQLQKHLYGDNRQPWYEIVKQFMLDFGYGLTVSVDDNFYFGIAQKINSNPLLPNSAGYYIGKVTGDVISFATSVNMITTGVAGEGVGLALDATGVGAIGGIVINAGSAALIASGATFASNSLNHLQNDVNDLYNYFSNTKNESSPKGTPKAKPHQVHHFATNKSKTYTPQIEKITKKYGLDLDETWNKQLMPHQGRHPNAYHEYVLENLKQFDEIAKGDKDKFLKLFDKLKQEIINNPEMLYKDYWKNK